MPLFPRAQLMDLIGSSEVGGSLTHLQHHNVASSAVART
jgi:hypothetical protein